MRIAVDTNVLVRYLTSDDAAQATEEMRVIEGASTVVISTIVLCELVWVLKGRYRYGREDIINIVRGLTESRTVEVDQLAVAAGLAMLNKGANFADGIIQHEASLTRCDSLVTFDRNFARSTASETVKLLGAA